MEPLQVVRRTQLALLLDFYGPLLTERQREVLARHAEQDLSLGEIAAEMGVSRQAVHDVVRRATATLQRYEQRLGLVARFERQRRVLAEMKRLLHELEA
jgi:predicted DNA-binding protein YlxM (UPF0122 family)